MADAIVQVADRIVFAFYIKAIVIVLCRLLADFWSRQPRWWLWTRVELTYNFERARLLMKYIICVQLYFPTSCRIFLSIPFQNAVILFWLFQRSFQSCLWSNFNLSCGGCSRFAIRYSCSDRDWMLLTQFFLILYL